MTSLERAVGVLDIIARVICQSACFGGPRRFQFPLETLAFDFIDGAMKSLRLGEVPSM